MMPKRLHRLSAAIGIPTTDPYFDYPSRKELLPSNSDDQLPATTNGRRGVTQSICRLGYPMILTVILAVLLLMNLILLSIHYQYHRRLSGTFEEGFATDLGVAKGVIELETVTFTGGVHFNETGHVYIEDSPGPRYVGPPEQAIDDAWDKLLEGMIINLPAKDAQDVKDRTYLHPRWRMYETGLDAFHQLHCVNQLRKLFEPDYYGDQDASMHGSEIHKYHCLDYLRQSIQCSADMTPIITYYQPAVGLSLPWFEQTHTCRNWDKITAWVRQKSRAHPRVPVHYSGGHIH